MNGSSEGFQDISWFINGVEGRTSMKKIVKYFFGESYFK